MRRFCQPDSPSTSRAASRKRLRSSRSMREPVVSGCADHTRWYGPRQATIPIGMERREGTDRVMEPMQMVLAGTSLVAALGLAIAGAAHVGWAAGRGTASLGEVVPTGASGAPLFRPPWWTSIAVAVALLGTAAAIVLAVLGVALPGL